MRILATVLCFILFFQVTICSELYYYGAPFNSIKTGFIKLESSSAWAPAADGFVSIADYWYGGMIIDPTGTQILIYGQFSLWNGSYVGNILRIDPKTMKPSAFNTGVIGDGICGMTYFDNGTQVAMLGWFTAFQQNQNLEVNNVGACSVDGQCYPLGGLGGLGFGSMKSIDNVIFALTALGDDKLSVVMYNTSTQDEWVILFQTERFFGGSLSMEIYQGTVWLFGDLTTPEGKNVSASRLNFTDFSWEYMENSRSLSPHIALETSVSPDGQSVYLMNYYRLNTTIYYWNNTVQDWRMVLKIFCLNVPHIAASNNGPLTACNSGILNTQGEELNNLTCLGVWQSLTMSPDNNYLYSVCVTTLFDLESTSYDLTTQTISTSSSITDFECIIMELDSMCVYGDKMVVTGSFDVAGGVKAPSIALWDNQYQKWYSLLDSSWNVTSCLCGTDGYQMAAVCTESDPVLILDYASSDSGSDNLAQNIQLFTDVPYLSSTGVVSQVSVINGSVYIAFINTLNRTNGTVFKWTQEESSQLLFGAASGWVLFAILEDSLFLAGAFYINNTSSSMARVSLVDGTFLPIDQAMQSQYTAQCYTFRLWNYTNQVYVGGNMNWIGDLSVGYWGGLNSSGKASDSVYGGLSNWVYQLVPLDNRMYVLTQDPDCNSPLESDCGKLLYYDADAKRYSDKITGGVTMIAAGSTHNSNDTKNSTSSAWKIYVIVGAVLFAVIAVTTVVLLVYQKRRKLFSDRYQEIPDAADRQILQTPIDFERDDFVMKSVLGRGAYGTVWSCVFPDREGATFAVKQMLFSKGETKQIDIVKQEIDILEKFKHPNIVQYCGHRMETTSTSVEFFIFMELYEQPCSLKGVIQKRLKQAQKTKELDWFTYAEVKKFLIQISEGLHYLHLHGIAHRDLKCANILIRMKGSQVNTLHIADFGISRIFSEGATNILASTVLGTPLFMAPEVLSNQKYDAFKADIWSFGMLMFEMMAWIEPQNAGRKPSFPEDITDFMNKDPRFHAILEIFDKCAQQDPSSRPTASDLLFSCESLA